MASDLPPPSADAAAASHALTQIIVAEIKATGGWMSFARYMELALYAPGLGYYSGGSQKFGESGDFMTAPELTPLFGQALARQVAQVLALISADNKTVIEVGGGSGRLAADMLLALDELGCLPTQYFILELSGELRARQAATLAEFAPALAARVEWLDDLPPTFSGCLIANEVLDAMPTHAVRWQADGVYERGVAVVDERLSWAELANDETRFDGPENRDISPLDFPYDGEISLAASAWVSTLARRLSAGALLLIDYGLPQHELYHPSRNGGTIRCHYRHRVHNDPFWCPGLSDITSHVDFTAVAEAGFDAGLEVLGYANQASFLINCGIAELLQARKADSPVGADNMLLRAAGAVNLLISPNEMGELFKVIALGRGIKKPLMGFTLGDRTHAL
ncbi:MAG: class I SAM-dependent methyltransferase [Rhodocyclaceae bacterium]|nr:class I SAM-dependent methyltransferase [Rhodocyclaceae bacterium]MBK9623978.1 class I SAM-dependent methyltransferase [Rhodocyclaceae bacterium]MBP6109009.1 class I SAM-dependent methyltransferase [Rhodocyclaceae bacterium]MBP6278999.1 class I SAM-dependent methyltransferase [Rhodocyclaceae bacterium]